MAKKPQAVPELSSAVDWAASLHTPVARINLLIYPESEGGAYVYAGAELVVRCSDGGDWVLRRVTERVSGRSDSAMCGAMFRGAVKLRGTFETCDDDTLQRLAEWDRGAAELRRRSA